MSIYEKYSDPTKCKYFMTKKEKFLIYIYDNFGNREQYYRKI